jgi:hypothetical protein
MGIKNGERKKWPTFKRVKQRRVRGSIGQWE